MELKKILIGVIIVIGIFTLGDFIGHKYLESAGLEEVPQQYYTNKMIFGSIILFIALLVYPLILKIDYLKPFILSALVVFGLQSRYYSLYSSSFNIKVLLLHYVLLTPILYYFIKKERL